MAIPILKTSFGAGEIAPNLWGRIDLAKYQSGVATMRNFFVDYRGGASTRPGTAAVGLIPSLFKSRLIPFQFNTEQTYQLELTPGKMRVITNGGYILNTPFNISGVTGTTSLLVTIVGSNIVVGDIVVIEGVVGATRPNGISGVNGRFFVVFSISGNLFSLSDPLSYPITAATWTPYVSGGTIASVFNVGIPWTYTDFYQLNYAQSADVLTVVHPNYPQYDIKRLGNTDWTITTEDIATSLASPVLAAAQPINNAGGQQFVYTYTVTAFNSQTGEEGNVGSSPPFTQTGNSALNQNTGVANRILWSAVAGADSYNIYAATAVPVGNDPGAPYTWGLIGTSQSLNFVDMNFAPDFTQVPPTHQDPFAGSTIDSLTLLNPGFGYVRPVLTLASPGGTYGQASLTSDASGAITGVTLLNGGTDMTASTYLVTENDATTFDGSSLSAGGGSGFAFTWDGTWNTLPPAGLFSVVYNLNGVSITNGGSGYPPGSVVGFVLFKGAGSNLTASSDLYEYIATVNSSGTITALTARDNSDNNTLAFDQTFVVTSDDAVPHDVTIGQYFIVQQGVNATFSFNGTWSASPTVTNGFYIDVSNVSITSGGMGFHVPFVSWEFTTIPSNAGTAEGLGVFQGKITNGVITSLVDNGSAGVSSTVVTTDGLPPTGGVVIVAVNSDTQASDGSPGPSGSQATVRSTVSTPVNYPSCVSYFEQRRVFAASTNQPDTFWASQPGNYTNFDTSFPSQADDAITGTIVGTEVNAITSLTPMTSGLIALTSNGAYLISGGAPGAAFTPSTAVAAAQAFSGASSLQPLRINYDLIYEADRGSAIRDLTYNFYVNVYTGNDISALSSHLLFGNSITTWAWAEEPFKVIWAVRDDGIMLSCTYMKDQDVYGWARHDTIGQFADVSVIAEGNEDAVYVVAYRPLYSGYSYVTERMASRLFGGNPAQNIPSDPAQAWCVDCGASYGPTYPAANLTPGAALPQGQLGTPIIISGGMNYPDTPFCQVIDAAGTGSGGIIALTATDGVITGATVVAAGKNYGEPIIEIAQGHGAVLSLSVLNLMQFNAIPDVSPIVGQVVRVAGGVGTVVSVQSLGSFTCDMSVQISGATPNLSPPMILPTPQGQWSLTTPVSVVGGLDILNGATVAILADGSVQEPQVVVDGCITLDQPATIIIAGLPFTAQLKTLRTEAGQPTMQGRRKTIPSVTLRMMDTRGVTVGPDFHHMTEVKDRTYENYGQETSFQTEGGFVAPLFEDGPIGPNPLSYSDKRINIGSDWNLNGQICVMQSYPLPCTVLAEIPEIVVGDTPSD